MSILLESLNQQVDVEKNQQTVPDIYVSHFDDEMLGDDNLTRQLKMWKLITSILLLLLISSWSYFYLSFSQTSSVIKSDVSQAIDAKSELEVTTDKIVLTQPVAHKITEPQASNVQEQPKSYKPVKRTIEVVDTTQKEISSIKNTAAIGQPQSKKPLGAAILIEELSFELQQKFPQIQIDSYVIADTEQDSFVILDNSFYKVDQMITPDLILRSISNEYIIVEFYSQLVKIPLK